MSQNLYSHSTYVSYHVNHISDSIILENLRIEIITSIYFFIFSLPFYGFIVLFYNES